MTQQPDNLFRHKLENYPIQVPDRAWSRIESNLDRSSLKVFWWRMAASFLIIATAGLWLWISLKPETKNQVLTSTSVQQSGEIIHVPTPVELPSTDGIETTTSQAEKTTVRQRKPSQNKNAILDSDTKAIPDLIEIDQEVMITATDVPEVQINEIAEIPAVNQTEAGLYLVYTADEVNEKYLRKSSSVEATPSDKKSSRMQKLMAVANNLTDVETGIRDLRQFKDEIFALNFLERKNNN